MKALSIRQPWAWAICHAGKDVENRSWPTNFRGEFLIHAGKGMTRDEYESFIDTARLVATQRPFPPGTRVPPLRGLERGGIVGIATLVGCVTFDDSPWFCGEYGFILRNVRALPFRPYKGALGFFDVDPAA